MTPWVLVGLGNPGPVHAGQRHNAGFWALDQFQEMFGFPPFQEKGKSLLSSGKLNQESVLLCKPLTYMNLSDTVVVPLVRFYKLSPQKLLVIHDDLDIKCGHIRFKEGGGHGGHNGLRGIHQNLGADYYRLRIGVDRPEHSSQVSSYVLGFPSDVQKKYILDAIHLGIQELPVLFSGNKHEFVKTLHSFQSAIS